MQDYCNRFDMLIFEDAQEMHERRERESKHREKMHEETEEEGLCEYCRRDRPAKWEDGRTFYSWNKDKDPLHDPNRSIFLCKYCALEYTESMTERWNDYYSGLL